MNRTSTAPAGWLEIHNRSGRLLQRLALYPGQRCVIGRDYACDLLLDDPYLCAQHAEIQVQELGEVRISDLGSRNGLRDEHGNSISTAMLEPQRKILLGHSQLKFRAATESVPESLPLENAVNLFALFDGGLRMWLAALAALAVIIIDGMLDQSVEPTVSALIGGVAVVMAVLLFWASIWALVGRLVAQHFRFRNHFAIALVGLATVTVLLAISSYSAFAWGLDQWLTAMNSVAILGSLAAILITHLHFSTGIAGRRLSVWVAAIGLPICSMFGAAIWLDEDEFNPAPQYSATLKLPALALRPAVSIDEFLHNATEQLAVDSDEHQVDG